MNSHQVSSERAEQLLEGVRLSAEHRSCSIFLVLTGSGARRDEAIRILTERIRNAGIPVETIRIDPREDPPEKALEIFRTGRAGSAILVDLRGLTGGTPSPPRAEETVRPPDDAGCLILHDLNLRRERFRSLRGPVVFLVDDISLHAMMRCAADLYATRSGIFSVFAGESPDVPGSGSTRPADPDRVKAILEWAVFPDDWPETRAAGPDERDGVLRWARMLEDQLRGQISLPSPNWNRIGTLHRELAGIHLSLGNIRMADTHFREEAEALRRLSMDDPGNRISLAGSLNRLGVFLHLTGEHTESRVAFAGALDILRDLHRAGRADLRLPLARTLNNLGVENFLTGHHEDAVRQIREAVGLVRELMRGAGAPGAPGRIAITEASMLGNLSAVLTAFPDAMREAERSGEASVRLFTEHRSESDPESARTMAVSSHNLGVVMWMRNSLQDARHYSGAAVWLHRQASARLPAVFHADLSKSLVLHGAVLLEAGQPDEALDCFREAIERAAAVARHSPGSVRHLHPVLRDGYLEASRRCGVAPDPGLLRDAGG